MIDLLVTRYHDLLAHTEYKTYRYLFAEFDIKSRLTGLIGQRGTGKTTLMLQVIREKIRDTSVCMYASLDHIYFSRTQLVDFVDELYRGSGIRYLFLDEVHKYPQWERELKNIYDSYPELNIVFSGSSSIDLVRGSYDLSRRGVLYRLAGLSFREYVSFMQNETLPAVRLHELLENPGEPAERVAGIRRLQGLFDEYLEYGYYPYVLEDRDTYHGKLLNTVYKTVNEDIPNFYRLKTENLFLFKRILSYLATIPPGELNRNSIARHTGADHKTVEHYLEILRETGLVRLLARNRSGSSLLKRTEKIYLDNPNLYRTLADETGFEYSTGTMREIFFISMLRNAGHAVHYDRYVDFEVEGFLFEVGGKNKTGKQGAQAPEQVYFVKDNVRYPAGRTIPLYLFGFLY